MKAINDAVPGGQRLVARQTVLNRTGLSNTTMWREIQRGEFPAPVQISRRRKAWLESSIDEWIERKILESRGA